MNVGALHLRWPQLAVMSSLDQGPNANSQRLSLDGSAHGTTAIRAMSMIVSAMDAWPLSSQKQ